MRIFPTALVRGLPILAALLVAANAHAEYNPPPSPQVPGRNLNIAAVNYDNGAIYSVTFTPPGGSTTIGNSDGVNYLDPEALAFVSNASTSQLDLIVADAYNGTITRYPNWITPPPTQQAGTLIWASSPPSMNGPLSPNALALDGYGDLFVGSENAPVIRLKTELWEFPVGSTGVGSFAATPVLIDSNFAPLENIVELQFVPADVAGASGVSGGDLLVLTTLHVFVYSKASGYATRTTLYTFPNGCPAPDGSDMCGVDFWPFGNGSGANYSLLISNKQTGNIDRYYFTNPLTQAPTPFTTGLNQPYRVKTIYQGGSPFAVVSVNGAILQFGANADGTGTLAATVTQNVTYPQGLAVSNSFTTPANTCTNPSGCNPTGVLNTQVQGLPGPLTGSIVEDVCAAIDPRVSMSGGKPVCNVPYTPPAGFSCPSGGPAGGVGCLPVNAICPGFDPSNQLVISEDVCGSPGLTIVRVQTTDPTQFNGAYVENAGVLADGSNPVCGPGAAADGSMLFAGLPNEGQELEFPFMRDDTSGCGSTHGGTQHASLFVIGGLINEQAPELAGPLPLPLQNVTLQSYQGITNTIDSLTKADPSYPWWTGQGQISNIAGNVSLLLWGGNVPALPGQPANPPTGVNGCLDQSWALFNQAATQDAPGSLQWTADLQNAANLVTAADASGATTCDSIVLNNPGAFTQTTSAPIELNPSGQVRSRLANIRYNLDVRLLGNPAPSQWPLPVSVNVQPTAVTLADNSTPATATLSWNTNGDSGCTLTSSDGQYSAVALSGTSGQQSLTIPTADANTIVKYTVACSTGPSPNSVAAYVTVSPPPTISVSPANILSGSSATLSWNTNGAQGCAAGTTDPNASSFTGVQTGTGSLTVTPPTTQTGSSYSYSLACTTPKTTVTAQLSVAAPPTVTVDASAALLGTGTMLHWNTNGSSTCSISGTDPSFVPPASPVAATGSAAVNPTAPGTYSYTISCSVPAASHNSVNFTAVEQPIASVSPMNVIQGSSATLAWATYNASACSWSSNDGSFVKPTTASGSQGVTPTAPGTFNYTVTCAAPAAPAQATLMVQAPLAPTLSLAPTSVIQGSSATLSWTISQGDVCSASSTDGSFTGALASGGSMSVGANNGPGSYNYVITCTAPANTTVTQTLKVTAPAAPTLTLSPASVIQGSSATLGWTLNQGDVCTASSTDGSFTGAVAVTGSLSVGGANGPGTYTYSLNCTVPANTTVSQTLTVKAPLPPGLSVSPSSITQGSSAKLSWTINPGDVCTASSTDNTFTGPIGSSGSLSVKPAAAGTYTYKLTCSAPANTTVSTQLVVNPAIGNIAIAVKGSDCDGLGDVCSVAWTLNGYTSGCVVSGTWPKYAVPQFSPFPVSSSGSKSVKYKTQGTYTYTLTCKAPSNAVSTSVSIGPSWQ